MPFLVFLGVVKNNGGKLELQNLGVIWIKENLHQSFITFVESTIHSLGVRVYLHISKTPPAAKVSAGLLTSNSNQLSTISPLSRMTG